METPGDERRHIHRARDMRGDGWKDAVEELLAETARRARAYAEAKEEARDDDLVMRIPVMFFVRFPREGNSLAANAENDCACTRFQDEDGSEVCMCIGTCPDFPDICDEIPVFKER